MFTDPTFPITDPDVARIHQSRWGNSVIVLVPLTSTRFGVLDAARQYLGVIDVDDDLGLQLHEFHTRGVEMVRDLTLRINANNGLDSENLRKVRNRDDHEFALGLRRARQADEIRAAAEIDLDDL